LRILLPPEIPVIGSHGYELRAHPAQDFAIRKNGPPILEPGVASGAQRMAGSVPEKNRLALGSSLFPGLPKTGEPGDFQPGVFLRTRKNQGSQRCPVLRDGTRRGWGLR